MRRLTDEDVARITSEGVGLAGPVARYEELCAQLQADYAQAREDRRRLALALAGVLPLLRGGTEMERGMCEALLAEVKS